MLSTTALWRRRSTMAAGVLCRYTGCVPSSGGPSVLVEEASEAIVAHQFAARQQPHLGRRAGQPLLEALMRSSPMVVLDEVSHHSLQMLPAEDQHVVQAL